MTRFPPKRRRYRKVACRYRFNWAWIETFEMTSNCAGMCTAIWYETRSHCQYNVEWYVHIAVIISSIWCLSVSRQYWSLWPWPLFPDWSPLWWTGIIFSWKLFHFDNSRPKRDQCHHVASQAHCLQSSVTSWLCSVTRYHPCKQTNRLDFVYMTVCHRPW